MGKVVQQPELGMASRNAPSDPAATKNTSNNNKSTRSVTIYSISSYCQWRQGIALTVVNNMAPTRFGHFWWLYGYADQWVQITAWGFLIRLRSHTDLAS